MDWNPVQVDFSGGQVSPRTLMRLDTEQYSKSVLSMTNWMPTLQGSAVRVGGTRFVRDLGPAEPVRIMPYLNIVGQRGLITLVEGAVNITGDLDQRVTGVSNYIDVTPKKQILPNAEFEFNGIAWEYDPINFTSRDGASLGVGFTRVGGEVFLKLSCRDWQYNDVDNQSALARTVGTIDAATDRIQMEYGVIYSQNGAREGGVPEHTASIIVGTTKGGSEIGTINLDDMEIGSSRRREAFFDLPTPGWTGDVFVQFNCASDSYRSTPTFLLDYIRVFANAPPLPAEANDVHPFLEDELDAVQFVQSPHGNKEIVMVHPNHPPHWIYYDTGTGFYVSQPIPILDTAGAAATVGAWSAGSYPASCTAFRGRLYLGGGGANSETVWASQVFNWDVLQYAPAAPTTPDGPLEFQTTFRSPIQWMLGHKDLVIGAQEVEYTVKSSSIFDGGTGLISPGDVDARVSSSHGSAAVQPVGYGQYVAFAAESGTKLRALQLNRENEGWIAPDLSFWSSDILRSGIKRLVRVRNPQQMVVAVLNDGNLAVLHNDSYAGVNGWSLVDVSGDIVDAAVIPDDTGVDVLYVMVERTIDDVKQVYLEAFNSWGPDGKNEYLSCNKAFAFDDPVSILRDFDHLIGQRVQIFADSSYIGSFLVNSSGNIVVRDGNGIAIPISRGIAGIGMPSRMTLLPPIVDQGRTGGVGAEKRYSTIGVRILLGTTPIINGVRPAERRPWTPFNQSQSLAIIADFESVNLGYDHFQFITIEEDVPLRCEILGIYGNLTSNTV